MSRNERRRRWFHGWFWPNVLAAGNGAMLSFQTENALITPSITLSGDGPCSWEVVEGDGDKFYYVGNSFSHDRIADGAMTVRLLNTQQVAPYITSINLDTDGIFSDFGLLQTSLYTNLATFSAASNGAVGDLANLRIPTATIQVAGNMLTGRVGAIPNTTILLYIYANKISEDYRYLVLPNSMQRFWCNSNFIRGLPVFTESGNISLIEYNGSNQGATNMTTALIDEFVAEVFSKRARFTYVAPAFNIGGTNSTPSGIYQFANPPTTGKEMIYWLVNDPLAEGFNKQTWTYTL